MASHNRLLPIAIAFALAFSLSSVYFYNRSRSMVFPSGQHYNILSRSNKSVADRNWVYGKVTQEITPRAVQKFSNAREVSVVTAYFNLGTLNKLSSEGRYTPALYRRWMAIFGRLDNPLTVFTDDKSVAAFFTSMRAHFPANRTRVILQTRDELWAFQLREEIQRVYSQPHYPRHPPNTINPLYSCAMHAKFELVQRVIEEGTLTTPFVAWLDIGLFRAEAKKTGPIHLTAPPDFNVSRIGYSHVNDFQKMSPADIIKLNKVWVGGASFLGTLQVARVYCQEYRRAVRKLLDEKLMSTDQQVIYSMYQPSFNFYPKVQLQLYRSGWFKIGYVMKDAP